MRGIERAVPFCGAANHFAKYFRTTRFRYFAIKLGLITAPRDASPVHLEEEPCRSVEVFSSCGRSSARTIGLSNVPLLAWRGNTCAFGTIAQADRLFVADADA